MVEKPNAYRSGVAARAPVHHQYQQPDQQSLPIRTRTGPVFRRPSVSNRQTSISSTNSTASRTSESPRDQATIRARRQNQGPPISSNIAGAKQPRKPVGMGIFESPVQSGSAANTGVRRRPSLSSSTEHIGFDSTRSSVDNGGRYADTAHNMTASRAAKLKTLSQPPPPRISQTVAAADSTLLTDQSSLAAPPRSPRSGKTGATTPSSKRMSVVPGHHASGLGARTISPTDTQRLKRRSLMPDAQSVADLQLNSILTAPPPPIDRPASRSPSMLPRKTSTPSSQRTTPDPNRKSYSSVSAASLTSNNTVRTSTGSLQPRIAQSGPSRLPAPKSMNSIPAANEEDEDVPPVPAIPKAYESPKDSPAELTFLDKRKSNLGLDSSSLRSTSTGSLSGPSLQEKSKVQRKQSLRKPVPNTSAEPDKKMQPERTQPVQPRRNLKSMNLPPLTVGPLSTPTVNKIAKLQQHDSSQTERKLNSSPPARQTAKTPSTPMTASKTTFFPKRKELAHYRSTSSVHQPNRQTSPFADTSSAESTNGSVMKASVSPYLSSSVPKEGGFEQAYFNKRSQTGSDLRKSEESTNNSAAQSKPSGPRAPRQTPKVVTKTITKINTKSPVQQSSPEEPQTPSSMTTLRRKLSLSWKRSSSKTEKHPENAHAKHDAMPPPRIPISATTGSSIASAKSGSPSVPTKSGTQQHDAARRKASSASLNTGAQHHSRNKSDTTGASMAQGAASRQVKVDSADNAGARPAATTSTSVMQKFLRSKASTNKMLQSELAFTADLDKDDLIAEEEMRKLGSRRKETELAAKTLDTLRRRATPKERVSPQDAIRIAILNIYERGEIIDYKDVFFCGTQNAQKVVGDLHSKAPNFGYDDDRGDYSIIIGDHLAYRYEIVDVLGKGSFGQVVRCIDHKTGVLVAVKIIRNKKRFHQQALVEVNILQKLREWVSHFESCIGHCALYTNCFNLLGSQKQAQHGQLYPQLLLPRTFVHFYRTTRHEPLRIYQGQCFPWLFPQNDQALHKTDAQLSELVEAKEGHSL